MSHHGMLDLRGLTPDCTGHQGFGRFGRLFPELPPQLADDEELESLGSASVGEDGEQIDDAEEPGPMIEPVEGAEAGDSDRIPAPFAFFGQFIDHDITLDVTTELEGRADPDAVDNFRTPALELDNVFGQGPEAMPFLYESEAVDDEDEGHRLLLHEDEERALPRNHEETAIIGDPRNDENRVIAKFHASILRFHNQILQSLAYDNPFGIDEICETIGHEARRVTRWTYQWLVVNEFLPLVCGEDVVEDIGKYGAAFYQPSNDNPYIPVEFAVAAYRFGHSQIRAKYRLNEESSEPELLFSPERRNETSSDVGESRASERIDWDVMFEQASRPIDTKLAVSLFDLPFIDEEDAEDMVADLAARNLRRGRTFLLPSGERVAERTGHTPDDIDLDRFDETPLWYYVLAEAEGEEKDHLGPVGGRIVAETLLGLLEADEQSYVNNDPEWVPYFLFDDLDYHQPEAGLPWHPRMGDEDDVKDWGRFGSDWEEGEYVLEKMLTFEFEADGPPDCSAGEAK